MHETEIQIIKNELFSIKIPKNAKWIPLQRPAEQAFRIRYFLSDHRYDINIFIYDDQPESIDALVQTKFETNAHSAFAGENIPPFPLKKQEGLVAWGCRYRFVDGGSARYRVQHIYVQIDDKIIHFSYSAIPEYFDAGFVIFNRIVHSVSAAKSEDNALSLFV